MLRSSPTIEKFKLLQKILQQRCVVPKPERTHNQLQTKSEILMTTERVIRNVRNSDSPELAA